MSASPNSSGGLPIFPILLVNFIGTLGYSIILPFLIVLVLKFGGNELIYGVMGATYSSFQFIGAPILGKWSDSIGRKKVLLLSQGGTFLAWVLFVLALELPNTTLLSVNSSVAGAFLVTLPLIILFLARALDGLTGGNVSVANAYLADITSEENRKSNFGKMSASSNLGFIIGPAFAGILGATVYGELLPVLAAMLISLVAIFVISYFMKESNPCILSKSTESSQIKKVMGQEHIDCYELKGAAKASLKDILRLDHIPFFLFLYFMIFLSFNLFYVSFPVHSIKYLQWDLFDLGIFFSLMGGVMVLVQGPVLSRISKRFSETTLILTGSVMLTIGFWMFTSDSIPILGLAIIMFASGNGIMWPSFLSLLSKVGPRVYQGAIQGFASSAGSLASIIGLISGGFIYSYIGINTFWIPGITMLLIFFLCWRLVKIEKETNKPSS